MKSIAMMITVLMLAAVQGLRAQDDANPFYINVNNSQPNRVYELPVDVLALEYHDYRGEWKEILLTAYDWKRAKVGEVKLSKTFGLNNFKVDLFKLGGVWEPDKIYTLVLTAEDNRKTEIFVKRVPKLQTTPPSVDILVNPIQFKCKGLLPNLVEYYGVINGGRPPYQVQWYVLNGQRTDFLFQPREEKIEAEGKTMVVSVDKAPEYSVVLYVTDACGNQGKKMVQVGCDKLGKNISTIFVEPLNKAYYDKWKGNAN